MWFSQFQSKAVHLYLQEFAAEGPFGNYENKLQFHDLEVISILEHLLILCLCFSILLEISEVLPVKKQVTGAKNFSHLNSRESMTGLFQSLPREYASLSVSLVLSIRFLGSCIVWVFFDDLSLSPIWFLVACIFWVFLWLCVLINLFVCNHSIFLEYRLQENA